MSTIHQRVSRGAALLDRMEPGWFRRIAADGLAMESCDMCVLGQIKGHYVTGYESLCSRLPVTFMFSASEHGFTLPDRDQRWDGETIPPRVVARFARLADAWRGEISTRLEGEA